jgi:hypothetical protein
VWLIVADGQDWRTQPVAGIIGRPKCEVGRQEGAMSKGTSMKKEKKKPKKQR